ncbi:Uncharacterised protein [Achromobacter aegrifaciens]|uniref:Uncharacterized protein n=1 Tax=Achromobacter aegrifaciens TaxID=1287736 RepID=A0AAD2IY55_ACHAE|nr:Uncharacterised protein [Achromobacter aegrifaciens]
MLGSDMASATRRPPIVHSCISGLCDRFRFSTSKPAGTRSTSKPSGMFWLALACTHTTSMSPVCRLPPSHGRPSGRYQPRLSWITSLRGAGVVVGLPWMSYSTNRDWLPVFSNCTPARSAADSDTVWSLVPPASALVEPLTVNVADQGVALSPPIARAASNSDICSCVDRYERLPRRLASCVSRLSRRSWRSSYFSAIAKASA